MNASFVYHASGRPYPQELFQIFQHEFLNFYWAIWATQLAVKCKGILDAAAESETQSWFDGVHKAYCLLTYLLLTHLLTYLLTYVIFVHFADSIKRYERFQVTCPIYA